VKKDLVKKYRGFMETLQHCDPPLAAYYSNVKPEEFVGPRGGFMIELKKPADILTLAAQAKRLLQVKKERFRCMFSFLARTRKERLPAVFDYENFGCPGCRFYLGFADELPLFNHYFIANGFPGLYRGERFAPSPRSSQRHAGMLKGIRAGGGNMIFEPLDNLPSALEPELVIFLADAEMICALAALVRFVTDEADAVVSPFGSGCASIVSWPLMYARRKAEKAVLGVFDPAARPYLPLGYMTLSMSYALFVKMLERYKKSFIYADKLKGGIIRQALPGWPEVRKRAGRMRRLLSGRGQADTENQVPM
jgi:hypothetical protein